MPRLDRWTDWDSAVDWDEVDLEGAEAFVNAHPEFYRCDGNGIALYDWCQERDVPATLKNLEVAYAELRPSLTTGAEPGEPPKPITVVAVQGGPAFPVATPEEARELEKVRDNPALSDHQRKARDEKLRRLAVAQRLAGRNFPSHSEPKIVI